MVLPVSLSPLDPYNTMTKCDIDHGLIGDNTRASNGNIRAYPCKIWIIILSKIMTMAAVVPSRLLFIYKGESIGKNTTRNGFAFAKVAGTRLADNKKDTQTDEKSICESLGNSMALLLSIL